MKPVHVVLGAAGGIGSALVRQLAEEGAEPVLAGRGESALHALAAETGGSVHVVDATSGDSVDTLFREVLERHGRVDGVVNCVGSILLRPAHRTAEAEWRATISANLDTAFHAVRAGAAAMRRTGGSIVLVSSAAARVGLANHDAIAAAKAGVVGLTLSAAATYASCGIRVNAVAPGLVRTPLSARLTSTSAGEEASRRMHPLGRLGAPDDVARAIAWLLDARQSWVTGQVLGVDGGLGSLRA